MEQTPPLRKGEMMEINIKPTLQEWFTIARGLDLAAIHCQDEKESQEYRGMSKLIMISCGLARQAAGRGKA
jgi:hypothetical protein